MQNPITWQEFQKIELRVGTIVQVDDFPAARNPAYILQIDFGPDIGIKKSSAQITKRYTKDTLMHRQVICVTNFPPKQIGPIMSECLITGFVLDHGDVILSQPEQPVPNGTRLA
ncbi:MAG: tRNA-binding protein [Bdellovibrionota bacterium]